jgi:hypothetical protein
MLHIKLPTNLVEIPYEKRPLICISVFPLLSKLNKPRRIPLVILWTTLWGAPFPVLFIYTQTIVNKLHALTSKSDLLFLLAHLTLSNFQIQDC